MDNDKKFLLKAGGIIFALLVGGSWLWVWIFPEDPNRYNIPTPTPTQSVTPNTGGGRTGYYSDPCEDEFTAEDYQSCLEDEALKDFMEDRRGEAGLP